MNGRQIISLVLGTTLSGCTTEPALEKLSLQERLAALANRPEPQCKPVIATCYVVAPSPDHQEYICPTCDKKTLYINKEHAKGHSKGRLFDDGGFRGTIIDQAKGMRKIVFELQPLARQNGYELSLDESSLCARCGHGKSPCLTLVATDSHGKQTRTGNLKYDDLTYLQAFFMGADYYPRLGFMLKDNEPRNGDGTNGYPLKEKASRISELLGLQMPASS